MLTFFIAGFSVVCVATAFSLYSFLTSRRELASKSELTAQIIGKNCSAALVFEDRIAARENLEALSTQPEVVAARIYDISGKPFADFQNALFENDTLPSQPGSIGAEFATDAFIYYKAIVHKSKVIGTIGIRSNLRMLRKKLNEIAFMFLLSLLMVTATAFFLSIRTQHFVTGPILNLAETMREVTEKNDYHLVANRTSNDEVGYLVDRFNDLLQVVREHETKIREEEVMRAKITAQAKEQEDLRHFNNQLERSNRDLQEFASVASHDLQEPLRKVLAFGDRLVSSLNGNLDERSKDYLERMMNATRRMQTLINDLLQYSRVSTKAQPFVHVELNNILQDVLTDLEVQMDRCHGEVRLESLPVIFADPTQMRQLFQNLIGNALKFHRTGTPPLVTIQGEILDQKLDYGRTGGDVHHMTRITVSDNGIGFDEKYSEQIFAIFQRLHGRNEFEGTGIGLSICKKIVERHGGSIIASSVPNQGTKFTIEIPCGIPVDSNTHVEETAEQVVASS